MMVQISRIIYQRLSRGPRIRVGYPRFRSYMVFSLFPTGCSCSSMKQDGLPALWAGTYAVKTRGEHGHYVHVVHGTTLRPRTEQSIFDDARLGPTAIRKRTIRTVPCYTSFPHPWREALKYSVQKSSLAGPRYVDNPKRSATSSTRHKCMSRILAVLFLSAGELGGRKSNIESYMLPHDRPWPDPCSLSEWASPASNALHQRVRMLSSTPHSNCWVVLAYALVEKL
ncbi:Tip elongation aberrant protein 1 [Fusarium oxysporum f. sp. albedinis]|nr:Tip elongation aberrant protein 1 [Fusarium oxysporum f. sp. albedinis]